MLKLLSRPPRRAGDGLGRLIPVTARAAQIAIAANPISTPWRKQQQTRPSSSASGSQWKQRQARDFFAREAKVKGLKSRAAFKLIEMDSKYKLFKKGQLVVDLGYAPGSWSQVAMDRTRPGGRVLGIDLIPAQPPKGVATIQGNFLSPYVQSLVRHFVVDVHRRQARDRELHPEEDEEELEDRRSYIDMERHAMHDDDAVIEEAAMPGKQAEGGVGAVGEGRSKVKETDEKLVDIVISDMMMNTSGMPFRDHAGSMDLCHAALLFASDTLRPGGHFVCKFYQGSEDKLLEAKLRQLFDKVFREKPESSRSESKEGFFVALRRKKDVTLQGVEEENPNPAEGAEED